MKLDVRMLVFMAFVFFAAAITLYAQSIPTAAAAQEEGSITPEEIIELAESKLYSPLRAGLKDLFYRQELALQGQIKSFWFKAPDKVKGIFGDPVERDPNERINILTAKGEIPVEKPLPRIIAARNTAWIVGNPISCLTPFGKFEIIAKDKTGTQLRFTGNPDLRRNFIWTHIDFYLNKDFHLVRIMEKLAGSGRLEEHDLTLKPYKENAKLLVIDTEKVIATGKDTQKVVNVSYRYALHEDFLILEAREFEVLDESNNYQEKYTNVRVNKGIEDNLFKEKT